MRLPREVNEILECAATIHTGGVVCVGCVSSALESRGLYRWLRERDADLGWDGGDVALSLLMSEAAGGEL